MNPMMNQISEKIGIPLSEEQKTKQTEYQCILCLLPKHYEFEQSKLLEHLFKDHNFVIGDIEKIADLQSYLRFWYSKFDTGVDTQQLLQEYTSTISSQEKSYYLLSDILPEDRKIRDELQRKRLDSLIEIQKNERETYFKRKCLFCKEEYEGDRKLLFDHMFSVHSLSIGLPDNLVRIHDFLDTLQNKIDNCICLYCEKNFKDASVLRLHMRKKKHFKISPKNFAV